MDDQTQKSTQFIKRLLANPALRSLPLLLVIFWFYFLAPLIVQGRSTPSNRR